MRRRLPQDAPQSSFLSVLGPGFIHIKPKRLILSTQLYTYSLIRSLYDQGDDIIDSFWPLVINVLPHDKTAVPVDALQHKIEEAYGLTIPEYSLSTIIRRASRKGYVSRGQHNISLTQAGLDYYFLKIEPEREAKRRVNELLDDAKSFIDARFKQPLGTTEVKELIQAFIIENLMTLEQFFTNDGIPLDPPPDSSSDSEKVLLDYFRRVEKTKPTIFQTLQDIVCGSVISAMVHTKELFKESGKKFDKTIVFLDSNYVFSLLGLRYEEENKPARELFQLMKTEGSFEFKVFDFSLHEITRLLKNYEKEEKYFHPNVKVRNSLFASLKAQGWTPAKAREFIVNLETLLWSDLKISITPTEVNLSQYNVSDDRRSKLAGYKPGQAVREQNHDLAAIDHIRSLRRKEVRRIEKAGAIFLTSDLKLALFNYIGEEHKENDTVSEVIPDRLLTNILWLKNPAANDKFTLDSIIANYSKNLFVDEVVWKRFYKNVAELRSEGSLEDKQVSILLFDRHIQEVLSEYEADEAEQIDPEEILKDIERIREERLEAPVETEVPIVVPVEHPTPEEKLRDDLKMMQDQIDKLKDERNEMVFGTIERWKKLQEIEAEREAGKITTLITGSLVLGSCLLAFYAVKPIIQFWVQLEPVAWMATVFIGIVLPLLGIRTDLLHWRSRLYARLFNIVLKRKLKNLAKLELSFAVDTESE